MNIVVSVNRPLLHQSSPLFVYSYFQNDTRAIQKLQKYRYQNIFEATAMQTVPLSRIEKNQVLYKQCYTNIHHSYRELFKKITIMPTLTTIVS